jgi:hypothetical protein
MPPRAAGGKSQAADEFTQQLCGVIVEALHECTKPVAAEGMRKIVVFQGMTASARPCAAERGEGADSHANAGGSLEGLVAQTEEGGAGDCVEPHATGPG